MKKFLSILLFALCLTVAANAQQFLAFDFENGNILTTVFTNDETYPWIVIDTTDDDGNAVRCIMSGNKGVASSTSAIETTVGFLADGYIAFDALCMGEGTNTAWDKCIFYIDGEAQFTYGAHIAGWNHYAYNVSAGSHTFKWVYKKDSSVNPTGDAFFVDNISFGLGTLITEINIIGFTKPAWGEHPDYEVSVPDDAPYTLGYVEWGWIDNSNPNNYGILPETGFFNNEDYSYYMGFIFVLPDGYLFSNNVTVTVNGEESIIDDDDNSNFGNQFIAVTKKYTVEAEPACVISEINIEGFTAPEWGANPDYDVYVEDTRYTVDYTDWNWDDGDDGDILGVTETFNNEDYVYYMYFQVLPIDGCTFAENVTFMVNGETGSIENGGLSDNGYYWAYTYDYTVTEPTTEPCVISEINIEGFTAPEWGANPDYEVNVPANANYTVDYKDWNWWDEENEDLGILGVTETFNNEDYVYYMYFEVLPNEGCTFADNVTFTLNGEAGTIDNSGLSGSGNGYWAYSIDYTVTDPTTEPCAAPTGLTATNITHNDATLGWTDNNNADVWYVDMDEYGDGEWAYYASGYVYSNSFSFHDYFALTPGKTYRYRVQSICSDENSSDFSEYYLFTTMGYCDAEVPTNLTTSDITAHTATVEWTENPDNYYNVKYIRINLFEDFENGLPADWTTIDYNGDGYDWYYFETNERAHSGTGVATSESYINYYGPLTPDNWLITPQINLNGTMRVWLRGQDPDYASEHFAIYLSTTNNSVDDFTITLVPEAVATGEYVEYTADLSAYAGQRGYIAIRHFNTYDMYRLNVDDFGVFLDDDWTTETVTGNSIELTGLEQGSHYLVQVQSVCDGDATSLPNSSLWSTVEFTTTEETEEPCEAPTNLTATNITANSATVGWTGNSTEYNVHYRVPGVETDTVFFEDFEDADNFVDGLPNGWTSIDHDGDGYNWIYRNNYGLSSIITSHSGVGVMYSQSYDFDAGALTPDNWLITPQIELGNIVKVWLTAQDPSYPDEHFAIYLSTTGNDVTDFTVTLLPKTKATGEYVEYTADLSAYAGQQGYIAIRHFNVTDEFYLNVDDFGVYNEELWTTITATGNTAELTDLAPETTYEVQVQGICEDGVTAWSEPVEFTTEAEPTCVINEVNVIGYEPPVAGENSQDHMNITVQDNNANYFLVEEEMFSPQWWDEDADEYFNGTFVGGTHYSIGVEIHANDGCVFANNCTFLFDGDENLVNPEYTGVYYEDNTIAFIWTMPKLATGTTSPCETPTGLTASNITATTAKLEWTGSQDQYTVRYKEDAASDWTEATTTNRFFPLTGLTPETTYTAQVQGDCGSGAKSVTDWSEPVTFTTLSGTIEPGECGPTVDCEGTSYPTVKIGDVCWMAKNLAAETCVTTGNVYAYVNDQFPDEDANVETYGLLYDEEAAFATGLCPEGYTLPTTEQFEYLKNNFTVEELRNSTGWVVNTGTNGTGFSWDGSGFYNGTSDNFEHMLMEGYLWAVDMTSGTPQPAMYKMMYYCNEIVRVYDFNGISASIRCVKDAEPQPEPEPEPEPEPFRCGTSNLKIGENSYETVQIGNQCWTKTNLRETKDKNGNDFINGLTAAAGSFDEYEDAVIYIPTEETWSEHNSSVTYDNNTFGYYYNWTAANNVCPVGWHLPSDAEWTTMEQTQTSMDVTGLGWRGDHAGKLAGGDDWQPSSTANAPGNTTYSGWGTSGFSAIPAGYCSGSSFNGAGYSANFWSSTQYDSSDAYYRYLYYSYAYVSRSFNAKRNGYSVRCLRDAEE